MPAKASSSITGPTSVASIGRVAHGAARPARRAASRSRRRRCASCTHSRRSAEQRWPALRKALCTTASTTCSGSAVLSTTIALRPPVSAISGTIGPSLAASVRLMRRATCVLPVKHTPAVRRVRPPAPRPRSRRRRAARPAASAGTPASCSSATKRRATTGVCSAGLAATVLPATSAATTWPAKMASGKFHGLMQTKTPRPCRRSVLLSPVGPGRVWAPRRGLGLFGVVAAEVHRLAHLGDAVAQGLVRLLHQQRAELGQARFQQVGGAAQHGRALGHRARVPGREAGLQARHRGLDLGTAGLGHGLDVHAGQRRLQRRALGEAGQVHAQRVRPRGAVQRHRQRQRRRVGGLQRRGQQLLGADVLVGQLVHERRVGAVLQQPPHQVGQQVAVLAHRGVDTAGDGRVAQHLAVDALAHAVQALQLEGGAGPARQLHDGRDGAGVVRGELRVDHVGMADQRAGAGQVARCRCGACA